MVWINHLVNKRNKQIYRQGQRADSSEFKCPNVCAVSQLLLGTRMRLQAIIGYATGRYCWISLDSKRKDHLKTPVRNPNVLWF
jgi:hypothetical protein